MKNGHRDVELFSNEKDQEVFSNKFRPLVRNEGAAGSSDLCKQEQEEALRKLFSEHQHYIYNLAYSLCSDTDDADDIVQETFIKATRGLKEFRSESNFRTWLSRIAVNTFIDAKRKERPHVSLDLGLVACPSGGPERTIIKKEMQWCVRHVLLHHIEKDHETVLVLRDMHGYSYEEIADIVKISVPAVKSRLHRARSAFYNHLIKSGCVSIVKDYTCYCEGGAQHAVYV